MQTASIVLALIILFGATLASRLFGSSDTEPGLSGCFALSGAVPGSWTCRV